MLDIGWNELLVIALVTIIVVGPKELPLVLRTVTQFMRKLRAMASEFQSGLDELARDAELQDLKKSIEKTASQDIAGDLEKSVDPTGEINRSARALEASLKEEPKPEARTPKRKKTKTDVAVGTETSADSPEPDKADKI